MPYFAKEVISANIEDELKGSYLDYAMSVIVGRALPDVRDGLKPVHRRVLFAMNRMGNDWNRAYKKSARVVGDVIGKYHPHGDSAVYDTIVRMAQDFSLRYMLVDGQGNFGSVDGDSAAAMRYTEIRLTRIAHDVMADLDKETVDFVPNYDGSEHEPKVMPSRLPNLLVNGSTGIAVGMATNMAPHNINETINATIAFIDDPKITLSGLMEHLPGPDFPTGGTINGAEGIREAYATGRGKIYVRAKADVVDDGSTIIIHELPYQVNKAMLLEKIADLVKEKKIEGIREIRDESDKDGMRAVIELRRGEVGEVVLNNLYRQTQMQAVFGINMVALVDGQPELLTLPRILEEFVRHRREVVSRRTMFELRKARERAHLLEGLAVALANIDPVIALIRNSKSSEEAKSRLLQQSWAPGIVADLLERVDEGAGIGESEGEQYGIKDDGYRLSPRQAQGILDMRLHRLTGLEQDKIREEYVELLERISDCLEILGSDIRLLSVIRDELVAIRDQYGDARRTVIREQKLNMSYEDMIAEEDVVVTVSREGYIKSQPVEEYRTQRRGGRGRSATKVKDEDVVDQMFVASTHDTVLSFSNAGKAYWCKVYELPKAGHGGRGRPMVNLLSLDEGERISAALPLRGYDEDKFLFFATEQGVVKKTALTNFSRPRSNGIIAVDLREGDHLIGVDITSGEDDVMLFTNAGKVLKFSEKAVRSMGRTARGVKGITLKPGQKVISQIIAGTGTILTATENGFGKRTAVEDYPGYGRGGQGVIAIQTSERNGAVVAALPVKEDDEVMLITDAGTLIRTPVATISVLGRNTQGVTLIGLGKEELLVGMALVEAGDMDDEPEGAENESSNETGSADDQDSSASSVDQSDGDNE
ncbi:MAG: DNA gyrase subunit A [Immundisolibacteraceae bacterium]|nr:DNA gyrase subunit A [Immundisolibacteraceae bacterium]